MKARQKIIVIDGGEILTPQEMIKGGRVLISGPRIKAVGRKRDIACPKHALRLNAEGAFVVPGLIETHICGFAGRDFREGTEALLHIRKNLVRFGVTGFLATIHADVSFEKILDQIRGVVSAAKTRTEGAQLLGIHLEGPYLNPAIAGLAAEGTLLEPHPARDRKLINEAAGLLRMVTLSPELKGTIPLIRRLKAQHIVAAGSHSLATEKQIDEAVKAGMRHVTHVFNAMGDRTFAEPGVQKPGFSDIILMNDRLTVSLIADWVHVPKLLARLLVRVKGVEKIILCTDAFMGAAMPPGQFTYPDGSRVTTADGQAHRLVKNGSLAGSIIALNRAVANMAQLAGVELRDAVRMATTNPARLIGFRAKGVLAPGKDADLLLVDGNMNVAMTMIRGEIVYSANKVGAFHRETARTGRAVCARTVEKLSKRRHDTAETQR